MATLPPAIPESIKAELLPSPSLSIKALTTFPLPSQHTSVYTLENHIETDAVSQFFSKQAPSVISERLITHLQHLPTPDATVIQRLVVFAAQAHLEGFQSVRYSHIQWNHKPENADGDAEMEDLWYPLWAVTFWSTIVDVKKISVQWLRCRDWIRLQLQQKKSPHHRQLAEQASILLTVLPWGKNKPRGLSSGSDPIHTLWRFLGPHWLSDLEMDDMLELIRERCLENPQTCSRFRVEHTHFVPMLLDAFNLGSDVYLSGASFGWLRALCKDLQEEGSTVITIVHLGALNDTAHWASLTIQKAAISFGDSFGKEMPGKLRDACVWWLSQHHVGDFAEAEVTVHTLPITSQLDGHSCGILADNALDFYVSGGREPLLGSSPADVVAQRLSRFNLVAQNIVSRVSNYFTDVLRLFKRSPVIHSSNHWQKTPHPL